MGLAAAQASAILFDRLKIERDAHAIHEHYGLIDELLARHFGIREPSEAVEYISPEKLLVEA